jgi:hypothetical protein
MIGAVVQGNGVKRGETSRATTLQSLFECLHSLRTSKRTSLYRSLQETVNALYYHIVKGRGYLVLPDSKKKAGINRPLARSYHLADRLLGLHRTQGDLDISWLQFTHHPETTKSF